MRQVHNLANYIVPHSASTLGTKTTCGRQPARYTTKCLNEAHRVEGHADPEPGCPGVLVGLECTTICASSPNWYKSARYGFLGFK